MFKEKNYAKITAFFAGAMGDASRMREGRRRERKRWIPVGTGCVENPRVRKASGYHIQE